MSSERKADIIEKLLNPNSYPHPTTEKIQLIETHISYVFLTGDYVYKVKKSLKFGDVLDYSTLEKRKYFCHEEVRLNKRLAPEIYLGVVTIDTNGKINGDKEIVEYAVKMIQLPQESLLKNVLEQQKEKREEIMEKIAYIVADFHKKNTIYPDNFSYYDNIYEKWDENFRTTRNYEDFPFDENLATRVYKFLEQNREFFKKRLKEGKIVDGHADLITNNIFWYNNKPLIFDCVEFNPSLRMQDQLEEICFLAMDLEFNNWKKESQYFVSKYLELMGTKEETIKDFVEFFKAYRAYIRAKVYYSQSLQKEGKQKQELQELALQYLKLAQRYCF